MATNVGEIDLSLVLNGHKFKKQLKNIDKQANFASSTISASLSKIGKAALAAFSVATVVKFGKSCLDVATETSNAWIGLNSILVGQGKSFEQAKGFINEYIKDGLVPLNNAVGAYKNLALRGYSSDQIQKTMNALKNSATFARQSTYSLGEAVQTATEGLKNENSIVVDNAGVTKNVAKMWEDYAKSIGKTTNNLTQAEKIQAEVNGILEETKFQSKDAAIYTNTYSGKIAQLNSAFTNMKVAIGNAVQPLGKLIVPVITNVTNTVTKLFTAFSGLLSLFGLKADSIKTVSGGIDGITGNATNASSAIDGIGDSAKETIKKLNGLAAFDNLNVLKSDDSSGSDNSNSTDFKAPDFSNTLDVTSTITKDTAIFDELLIKVKEFAKIFQAGFQFSFGDADIDGVAEHVNSIKDTIIEVWTDPEVINCSSQWIDTLLYSLGQATGSVSRVAINLAEGFIGSLDKYFSQNIGRIKNFICKMFDISVKDIALSGNILQVLGEISDIFSSDTAKQIGSNILSGFSNSFMSAIEVCSKFAVDIKQVLFQPIVDNADRLKAIFNSLLAPIETFTGTLSEMFTLIGDKWNEVYDNSISPFLEDIKTGLSDTFSKFLEVYNQYIVPFIEGASNKFSELWDNHLKPLSDSVSEFIGKVLNAVNQFWNNLLKPVIDWAVQNILPILVPILDTLWDTICNVFGIITDTINTFMGVVNGVIDFIVGVFTGDWEKAWNGIKDVFGSVLGGIEDIFNGVWNTIKDVFQGVIDWISNGLSSWKNTISEVMNAIKNTISSILNTIKSIWNNIWNGLSTTVKGIFNGIWKTIKGVINSILGGIESMANGVINGINGMVKAMNNLSFDIPNWVPLLGGKKFGFSLPKLSTISIPKLAQGAYVKANTPQLTMIGDNMHQGEFVAPEDKLLSTMLSALKLFEEQKSDNQGNTSESREIIINFTGQLAQFIRLLKPELDKESKRRGDKLVIGVANE